MKKKKRGGNIPIFFLYFFFFFFFKKPGFFYISIRGAQRRDFPRKRGIFVFFVHTREIVHQKEILSPVYKRFLNNSINRIFQSKWLSLVNKKKSVILI